MYTKVAKHISIQEDSVQVSVGVEELVTKSVCRALIGPRSRGRPPIGRAAVTSQPEPVQQTEVAYLQLPAGVTRAPAMKEGGRRK